MESIQAKEQNTEAVKESVRSVTYGVTYSNLFWLFFAGSIIGFILEGIWDILRLGHWGNHSALVWGPFCIIYGVGAAGMYFVSSKLRALAWWQQFIVYAFIGTAMEYFGSLAQEKVFGTVSWDYSDHALNIGGRVSLQMTLIWGFLGVLFAHFIFPRFAVFLSKMETRPWYICCAVTSVFMAVNLLFSAAAIMRWRERDSERTPSNEVEAFLDFTYPNERMESLFPNMIFR